MTQTFPVSLTETQQETTMLIFGGDAALWKESCCGKGFFLEKLFTIISTANIYRHSWRVMPFV